MNLDNHFNFSPIYIYILHPARQKLWQCDWLRINLPVWKRHDRGVLSVVGALEVTTAALPAVRSLKASRVTSAAVCASLSANTLYIYIYIHYNCFCITNS